jgi:hypothetical protein
VQGGIEYDTLMMCRAITDAKRVEVLRRLTGSFQEGTVLQVLLTPRDNAPNCHAVVKRGRLDKADQEVAGQAKLMWYWDKVGRSLPPLRKYPSLTSGQELVLVTPFAEGQTLSKIAEDRWYGDPFGRVNTFTTIFSAAKRFLGKIQRGNPCEHGLESTFESVYKKVESARRRKETIEALQGLIGPSSAEALLCQESDVRVPNPLLLFIDDASKRWHWKAPQTSCTAVTYGHGDFHVGNLLVDLAEDGTLRHDEVTVLDYDYVRDYCCYYDRAQLESSFLLEVALAFDVHHKPEKWDEYFLRAIKVLTSGEADLANNEFARDIVKVLSDLRENMNEAEHMLYYGALLTTLLRVSKSQYFKAQRQKPPAKLPRSAQRTIVILLGLLLSQLIEGDAMVAPITTRELPF